MSLSAAGSIRNFSLKSIDGCGFMSPSGMVETPRLQAKQDRRNGRSGDQEPVSVSDQRFSRLQVGNKAESR